MDRSNVSLRSLFLILVYAAICCTTYIYPNLWFGTLVVVATVAWLASATLHAFNHHSHFSLGFALFGWSWLVFWLGFYAETPVSYQNWALPQWIYSAATPLREFPEYDPSLPVNSYGRMHSLHSSGEMGTQTEGPVAPSFHNAIRLVVCLSSLVVGLAGAVGTTAVCRHRDRSNATHV